MTNVTPNLSLVTFNKGVDLDESFEQFRDDLDGVSNSNMTKVDDFSETVALLFASTLAATSASLLPVNNFVNSATGSITSIKSASSAVSASFLKIAEFSGSGQADFINLNQNFKHIIIFGVSCIKVPAGPSLLSYNIGCDFNGDSTGGNYRDIAWTNSGSSGSSTTGWSSGGNVSDMSTHTGSQIILANVTGSSIWDFGSPFLAMILNYSGTIVSGSGFYKTAMGVSAFVRAGFYPSWEHACSLGIQGGIWTSASPITRIRMFGSDNSGSRMDFSDNTTISLYGMT